MSKRIKIKDINEVEYIPNGYDLVAVEKGYDPEEHGDVIYGFDEIDYNDTILEYYFIK